MSIYWLDSGVLITAHRGVFSPEITPGFWTFIETQLKAGTVRMPKMCYDEVTDGNDWLAQWCKARKNIGYFCVKACDHPDAERHQTTIADHVYAKHRQSSAAEFLKGGDPWVMAFAMATNGFVVTEELRNPYKSKIKIPHIAKLLKVPCKATHEMCKELDAKFR